ncbi:hypothetical protein GQ55_6G096900 [Panicum hallii var. hallii]|uniref:Uncharacterized protein n=1 Tax=Panicum hallii var. hallii TaxID=1504633 RepID=A0A2T7D5I4_9POAL|nr:hypothetical protein GQ55_6G096900 [Panicum hallii var. hallii]
MASGDGGDPIDVNQAQVRLRDAGDLRHRSPIHQGSMVISVNNNLIYARRTSIHVGNNSISRGACRFRQAATRFG